MVSNSKNKSAKSKRIQLQAFKTVEKHISLIYVKNPLLYSTLLQTFTVD